MLYRIVSSQFLPSFQRNMLEPDTEGDSIMLRTLSVAFGVRITVVIACNHRVVETRYRHDMELENADIVLLYNGHSHYTSLSECDTSLLTTIPVP